MRPRHFTSFSVIVFLAKPASYTALGLVGCCGRVESCRLYPARFPLFMRAAQLLVSLLRLGWLTDRNSSAIIVLSHALWADFSIFVWDTDFWWCLYLCCKKDHNSKQITLVGLLWTLVNFASLDMMAVFCLTQQVVLEPIGSNLSFCIDKCFLGSGLFLAFNRVCFAVGLFWHFQREIFVSFCIFIISSPSKWGL